MSKPKLNDTLFIVHTGIQNVYIEKEDNGVYIHKNLNKSKVVPIYLCAISTLDIVEESKKFFFSITERYYYSIYEKGGVCDSYFTLNNKNPDGGIGRTESNNNVFATKKEANRFAKEIDDLQLKLMTEKIDLIKINLTKTLELL